MLGIGFALLNYTNGFVGCAELIVVKTPQKHVIVDLGQDALLQCTFETTEESTDTLTFTWDFVATGTNNSIQVPTDTSIPI